MKHLALIFFLAYLPAPGLDAQGAPPARRPVAGQSANDRAAAVLVRAKLDSHWVRHPDGWITQVQLRTLGGDVVDDETPDPLYLQYRELTFKVKPEVLSEAQRLNGIDYRCRVSFENTPERVFHPLLPEGWQVHPVGWAEWKMGFLGSLAVERRNGRWGISDSPLFSGRKPDPARFRSETGDRGVGTP